MSAYPPARTIADLPLFASGRKAEVEQARRTRDDGMARAEEHADAGWIDAALAALRTYCLEHAEVFCDDFWNAAGLPEPHERRALGPVFMRASRLGWIEKTGEFRRSVRSNLSEKPVWRSRLRLAAESRHA